MLVTITNNNCENLERWSTTDITFLRFGYIIHRLEYSKLFMTTLSKLPILLFDYEDIIGYTRSLLLSSKPIAQIKIRADSKQQ